MLTRSRRILLCAALPAAALTLVVNGAASASATRAAPATGSGDPSPTAVHRGAVQGVERGAHISLRTSGAEHAFRVLHAGMFRPTGTTPDAGIHVNVGTSFNASPSVLGSQAKQSVSTAIRATDPGTYLYTPTMYPSGGTQGSCIEVTTAYTYGDSAVAAWDWCHAINFVAEVPITKSFMKSYTTKSHYEVQIVQTDAASNTWTAYLYNYATAAWEVLFTQSGTSQISPTTQGWDVYELYSDIRKNGQSYACGDLQGQTVDARKIMIDRAGTWKLASPKISGHAYDQPLSNFDCAGLTYTIISPNDHFAVTG
jgi:hypothetical protein